MTLFADKVYKFLRKVPAGKITTYRDIAHALGSRAYRAVGNALRDNPHAPAVPCHRVVASDGKIGGFCGKTKGPDIARKIRMLSDEGVDVKEGRVIDFQKKRFKFRPAMSVG
jgi:methylated-DNA-[protein]-cysteine S-methyltransferase